MVILDEFYLYYKIYILLDSYTYYEVSFIYCTYKTNINTVWRKKLSVISTGPDSGQEN